MVSTDAALGLWTDQICSIAVGLKDYVAGLVDDIGIRVASGIIKEVDGGIVGTPGICAGGNVIEGMHHGIVNCSGIEEQFSGDLLQEFCFLAYYECVTLATAVLLLIAAEGHLVVCWTVCYVFGLLLFSLGVLV